VSHRRIRRDQIGYFYDALVPPVLPVRPPTTVVFETHDARGAMFANPVGKLVDLPRPPVGRGNPVTGVGPRRVRGASFPSRLRR
jgi:hypothetical protein